MAILKIGVTGSAGSGKSLVCEGFCRLGLEVFDCDAIARQVVLPGQPAYKKVVALFGPEVVLEDGSLDRKAMRQIIVSDSAVRKALEDITHPAIIREMLRLMDVAPYKEERACAVEVPLLFELGMEGYFDVTVAVVAEPALLERRITERDGVDVESAQKMLALQMSQEEKAARADFVLRNSGNCKELFTRLDILYKTMKKSA